MEATMRLLYLAVIGALVAVPAAIIGSAPADAARSCKCNSITSSGFCTNYSPCTDLPMVVDPATTQIPFRNTKACRRTQALVCDGDSCKVVCDAPRK
jgi:hypothetical protein